MLLDSLDGAGRSSPSQEFQLLFFESDRCAKELLELDLLPKLDFFTFGHRIEMA